MNKAVQEYFLKVIKLMVMSCFALQFAAAQAIHSSVDKKDILIGQQINYDLNISLPSQEYKVSMSLPDSIPHFDVIIKNAGDTVDKNGKFSWHQHITFTSFDSGSWTFPQLQYRINHLNTASQPLYTDTFIVNVGYMPIDKSGNPRDIRTVIEVNFFDWFWIWVGAGILALLIILFFVIRYFVKKKKVVDPYKGKASAYDEALAALNDLRQKNKEQSLAVKDFYTMLSDVFKRYYGRTSGQDLMNQTSGDLLQKLKGYQLNAEAAASATQALQTSDAVKFAKYHPTFIENEAALDYVKNTIEETERSLKQNSTKI